MAVSGSGKLKRFRTDPDSHHSHTYFTCWCVAGVPWPAGTDLAVRAYAHRYSGEPAGQLCPAPPQPPASMRYANPCIPTCRKRYGTPTQAYRVPTCRMRFANPCIPTYRMRYANPCIPTCRMRYANPCIPTYRIRYANPCTPTCRMRSLTYAYRPVGSGTPTHAYRPVGCKLC